MTIRQTVFALVLAGASISTAFASSGIRTLNTDAGFEFHPTQSAKSRLEVMKELEEFKKASGQRMNRPTINSGDSLYAQEQHSYAFENGRLVHTDDIAHNTPAPSLKMSAAEQRFSGGLYRN